MDKIGLITYHAAYNFGSVLQAFGTVRTLEKLGYDVETIDYQTKSQISWYHTDFSIKKGIRSMIYNFGFLFIKSNRKRRAQKFEDFIAKFLHPSKEKYFVYEDFRITPDYDILISGSDQVWNIRCGEFKNEISDAILPYFLKFGNPKKRIAYASSFGNQNFRNIKKYSTLLRNYNSLSTREPIIREYMERILGEKVELVCDPTWLLSKEEWCSLPGIYRPNSKRPYVLVYALYWNFMALGRWLSAVKSLAEKNDWDVICISPLNYHKDNSITMLQDAGPVDFLSYMANAEFVVTNTFHGTIFSMNFEKPFFSCQVQPSSRQGQMLSMCGLEERIVDSPKEIIEAQDLTIDFKDSSRIIEEFRRKSIKYLEKALSI